MNQNIEWNSDLEVGIAEIDTQHKTWVDHYNQLNQAFENADTAQIQQALFVKLCEFSQFHFSTEEVFFHKVKYHNAFDHKLKHYELEQKLLQVKSDLQAGKCKIDLALMTDLHTWIERHILEEDKVFATELKTIL